MHKRRLEDYYTDVLQQELNEIKEPAEIYYHNEFQDETKRDVNPFKGTVRPKQKNLHYLFDCDENLYTYVKSKIKWRNRHELFPFSS